MTRWEAFTAICAYLRAGLLGGEREINRDLTWELIIEVASFHYVTPALASCLSTDKNVPGDVRDYLESALALNRQRNELLLSGLARVASLLNAIDIEPVLLKGAAHLVEGTYPEPSLRILGDVDILIPVTQSMEAFAALEAAGFSPCSVAVPPTNHHLRMMRDPETGMGVELHTDVIHQAWSTTAVPTAWFCEITRPASFQGHRVRLPEPTRNIAHTIFHSEIFHIPYEMSKIQLRHLLDVALIRAQHEEAIDWNELDSRFSAAGFPEMLATYLHYADELFGQVAPTLSHVPRRDAMAELRSTESRDGFHLQIEFLKRVCDNQQTALGLTMADRDRIQCEVGRFSTQLEDARRARAELEGKLASAERVTAELENARCAQKKLEDKLTAILSSRTWRLTEPLRAFVKASRRWLG